MFAVFLLTKGKNIMLKKFFAEFLATAILVLIGCGTAMGVTFMNEAGTAAGVVAISAAFGLAIIVLAYTVGTISGGHANPAVSFAKALNKEITWKEFGIYVAGQVAGAFFGSLLLAMVFWSWGKGVAGQNGMSDIMIEAGKAATNSTETNWFMTTMLSFMAEIGLTFLFVFLVLWVTNKKELGNKAGLLIALALFAVHLVGTPLTGTSVNPARALSPIIFSMFDGKDVGYKALCLIPSVLSPFMGSFVAATVYKAFNGKKEAKAE